MRGITDLMVMPGLINLDFADIRTIMANMGKAMMGTGEATGDDRAIRAAEQAIANPLLDEALKGARGLIISITGGDDMRLMEVDEVASHVKELVDPDADIIWGSAFDPALEGRIRVSVVATGIAAEAAPAMSFAAAAPRPCRRRCGAARRCARHCSGRRRRPLFAPVPAPVVRAPVQVPLPLEAPAAAAADDGDGTELLLTVDRALLLTPPEERGRDRGGRAVRGRGRRRRRAPNVIDWPRSASAAPACSSGWRCSPAAPPARCARPQDYPPLPHLYRGRDFPAGQEIARAA